MEKMRYLLCLFLYSLKEKDIISVNTLFRYVYIYAVSNDYLSNSMLGDEEFIIDKNIGIGNYSVLLEAIQSLNELCMIERTDVAHIRGTEKLNVHVERLFDEQDRVKKDLNRITYFTGIISNYSEDVILSIFYNEPNVIDATNRNIEVINLKNNKLYGLLNEFEKLAKENGHDNLDKYDVFTAWLDFVFEGYAKGKESNE